MGAVMICLAVATLGIDVGWQPLPDGRMEYIIQIEPQTLDALRSGEPILSDIPSSLGDIRSYRIMVGSKKLPHTLPPPAATQPAPPDGTAAASEPTAPNTLPNNLVMQRFSGQATAFDEPSLTPSVPTAPSTGPSPAHETTPQPQPDLPWMPLIFTLFGLFASFAGNVFLGWVVWDLHKRCRTLLGRPVG